MRKLTFLSLLLFILGISCFKQNSQKIYFSNNTNLTDITHSTEVVETIPINKKNLELYLGKDYKILEYKLINLDTDIEDELITITEEQDKNVKISIFDVLANNNIKRRYEYITNVFYNNDFSLQVHNLFEADDIGIVLEGRSGENKNWLYLFSFLNDNYMLLEKFSGDFAILTDYEEVDPGINKQKYIALDKITTINNILSSTNTNLHEKSVYKWNGEKKKFELIEKSEVQTATLSSIDKSITSSKEKFFQYLLGFWYPINSIKKIEKISMKQKNIDPNDLQFVYFNKKEFSIKIDDYITKYKITKMIKLWGKKPKLRLKLNNFESLTATSYKRVDITLLSMSKIQIIGPGKYDSWVFIRLQKPLIEYLNEKQNQVVTGQIEQIKNKLIGKFVGEKITIDFTENNRFKIIKENKKEFGIYQLLYAKQQFIINFIFESENTLLGNDLFIIEVNKDNSLTLIPVKLGINDIKIKNLKSLIFYKEKIQL